MATINADLLRSKFGFNNDAVIQGILKDPSQVERYNRELNASSGGSTGSTNFDDTYLKQAMEIVKNSVQPVISAITEQKNLIPQTYQNIKTGYENTKTSIGDRYDAILASLTNKEAADKGAAGLATSREFGKRGIPLSSGSYDQALLEKTLPISQFYAGQGKDVSLQKETDIMGIAQKILELPTQEAKDKATLDLAMAEANKGNSESVMNILLQMSQAKTQSDQFNAGLAQSQNQFESSQNAAATQFSQNYLLDQQKLAEQIRQNNISNTKSSTSGTSTTTNAKSGVISMAQQGKPLYEVMAKFGANLPVSDIEELYWSVYQDKPKSTTTLPQQVNFNTYA